MLPKKEKELLIHWPIVSYFLHLSCSLLGIFYINWPPVFHYYCSSATGPHPDSFHCSSMNSIRSRDQWVAQERSFCWYIDLLFLSQCNVIFTYFITIFTISRNWRDFLLALHLDVSPFPHSYHSLRVHLSSRNSNYPLHGMSCLSMAGSTDSSCSHPVCLVPTSWNSWLSSLIPWDFDPCIFTATFPGH